MKFIGSERQLADNDIAVGDAVRLSECWQRLQALRADEPLQADGVADASETRRWQRAVGAGEFAARQLRCSISNGHLQIWRVDKARAVLVTPQDLSDRTIKSGVFHTYDRPLIDALGNPKPPEIQGALLWVKRSDWRSYLTLQCGKVVASNAAESACRAWLTDEFAADPDRTRKKIEFSVSARARVPGLSERAFIRAWNAVAPQAGRSTPGRKS